MRSDSISKTGNEVSAEEEQAFRSFFQWVEHQIRESVTALMTDVRASVVDDPYQTSGVRGCEQIDAYIAAARSVRETLVNHCRNRQTGQSVDCREYDALVESFERAHQVDLLTLDSALSRLAPTGSSQLKVVELRVFAGLSIEQVAELLHVPEANVERDWRLARAKLYQERREAHL